MTMRPEGSNPIGEPEILLSVRGLTKTFSNGGSRTSGASNEVDAVDDVSFDLRVGETLGLLGESGSGKSTVGRMIVRLVEPSAGTITFGGADVLGLRGADLREFRGKVQIVFQDPFGSLDPRLTAGETLDEVLRVRRPEMVVSERAGRVAGLLDQVGLHSDDADRLPHVLSGGQRQRLGIARALAVEPRVIVLDEPVSALDVSVQAQVIDLLQSLQRDLGLTYLFIAHDIALMERVSDRVAVMFAGRIVEVAPVRDLFERPIHPFTQALLAAVPRVLGGRGEIPPVSKTHSVKKGLKGCPYYVRCPLDAKDASCLEKPPALASLGAGHLAACPKSVPPGPSEAQ